uniref:Uncharacterized protein n=1 Tax=Anopheles dirus TaxID=7168 RepID=A0A182N200_9DIPT
MASKKLQERAETAVELAKDFLLENDDESFDDDADEDDDEDEDEHCVQEEAAEADPAEDDKKNTNDGKTKANDPATAPEGKKASRGVTKKMKSLMGVVMQPFGSKLKWTLNFNLGVNATNENTKRDKTSNAKSASPTTDKEPKKPLSPEAEKIKSLESEIKRQRKIAAIYLDDCIKLRTRIGELSEIDGQLTTVKKDNERLKEELLDLQKQRQNLTSSMAAQTEDHRKEIKRLDSELRTAAADLVKIEKDLQTSVLQCNELKAEITKQQQKIRDLQHVNDTIKASYEASNAKVIELQRAVKVCITNTHDMHEC